MPGIDIKRRAVPLAAAGASISLATPPIRASSPIHVLK